MTLSDPLCIAWRVIVDRIKSERNEIAFRSHASTYVIKYAMNPTYVGKIISTVWYTCIFNTIFCLRVKWIRLANWRCKTIAPACHLSRIDNFQCGKMFSAFLLHRNKFCIRIIKFILRIIFPLSYRIPIRCDLYCISIFI